MKREIENINQVAELFPWEPSFDKVVITLNTVEEDSELTLSDKTMSDVQYVVAVGPMVNQFKVGDKVLIDVNKLIKHNTNPHNTHETYPVINIDPIEHEGYTYTFISDKVIKAKYKG